MRRLVASTLMLSFLSIGLIGCAEKSSTTTEKTVTTPQGKTTIKTETEVKKTGDNPPPAN
jgi:hypothetical protein